MMKAVIGVCYGRGNKLHWTWVSFFVWERDPPLCIMQSYALGTPYDKVNNVQ